MTNAILAPPAVAFLSPVAPPERVWWRVLAVVAGGVALSLLLAVAVLAVATIVIVLGSKVDVADALRSLTTTEEGRPLLSYMPAFAMAGLTLAAAGYAVVQVASWVHRRPMMSFLTAAPGFRWRAVGAGLLVAAPLTLAAIVAEAAWLDVELSPPVLRADETLLARLGYALGATVFLYLAALAEEVIFRGWMMQQVAAFTRRATVIVLVTGIVFSAVHGDPNPSAFVARTAMGVGFAWIVLRTGGIEFASGAHLANNLMIALFASPAILQVSATEDYDLRAFAAQGVVILAVVMFVEWALRRPGMGRRLGLTL